MFKISIKNNELQKVLADTTSPNARQTLFRTIGALVERSAKDGARSQIKGSFGKDVARSVNKDFTPDSLTVGATHYAAYHKQFGGIISAPGKGSMGRGAKFLTIPISPRSRGKNVSDFNNIFRVKNILFQQTVRKTKKGGTKNEALFVLKKSVKQRAFPWFPWRESEYDSLIKSAIIIWQSQRS
jgi:phage gpG-like protein